MSDSGSRRFEGSAVTAEWRSRAVGIARKYYPFLLLLPLLFYLAIPTRNYYWDGVAFAIDIEKNGPSSILLHPNHLVYALCGAWLYGWAQALGIGTRALFVLQVANSVLAGLCVPLLHACLRRTRLPAAIAVPAALAFGFSATWWRFATDANAYVPSIFFLLTAFFLIERSRTAALAGLAHTAAILFHQLAILFLPVALVRLRGRPRAMAAYSICAMVPPMAAYLAAYRAVSAKPTVAGLIEWSVYHSPDSGFSFHPLANLVLTIRGTFRLFFGGKLSDFTGGAVSWAVLCALVFASLAFGVYTWRAARSGLTVSAVPRHLLVWAGVYVLFLFFWMPQNTFYRLFYLPPLIAIFLALLGPAAPARVAVWLFVPVLFLWNFAFVVQPQSRLEFNVPLHFALAQRTAWPPGTPILFHKFHPDLWTISYFNMQVAWISTGQEEIVAQLERNLEYARSAEKQMWLEATAYEFIAADPNGRRWLAVHERPGELLEFKDQKHHFQFHCVR